MSHSASPINSTNSTTRLVVSGTTAPIYNSTVTQNLIAAMLNFIEDVREKTAVNSLVHGMDLIDCQHHQALINADTVADLTVDRAKNSNDIVPTQSHQINCQYICLADIQY